MASIVNRNGNIYVVYKLKDKFGKSKQVWESGFESKETAQDRIDHLKVLLKQGKVVVPDSVTLEQYFPLWLEKKASKWSPKNYSTYHSHFTNHIIPHLGHMPMQKIRKKDIENLFETLSRTLKSTYVGGVRVRPLENDDSIPPEKKKYLSQYTIRGVDTALRAFFNDAVDEKLIAESPMPGDKPQYEKVEKAIWDDETMAYALSLLEEDNKPLLHLAIHMAFVGALRNGEAMGILTDRIDLKNGRVAIRTILQRANKEALKKVRRDTISFVFPNAVEDKKAKSCLILKMPKTKNSIRDMLLTGPLVKEIRQRLEQIQQDKERLGKQYNDYGLLFCLENGNPIEPALITKWFEAWQKNRKENFPELNFHGLRHSGTTSFVAKSYGDYKSVQGITGHSTMEMIEHYTHGQDKARQRLVDRFEESFYSQNQNTVQENTNPLLVALVEKAKEDASTRTLLLELSNDNPDMQKALLTAILSES